MADDISNLILEHLKRIRASQDRTELDIGDMKTRLSAVEVQLGSQGQQIGTLNQRLDRLDERMARIEKRLDLVEA